MKIGMHIDTESVEAFACQGGISFSMQSFPQEAMLGGVAGSPQMLMSDSDEIIFLALDNRDMTFCVSIGSSIAESAYPVVRGFEQ